MLKTITPLLLILSPILFVNRSQSRANIATVYPIARDEAVIETLPSIPSFCNGEVNKLFCNPEFKWNSRTMLAICMVENGYLYNHEWDTRMVFDQNPDGSIDRGICSINSIHGFDSEALFKSEYNVIKAHEIWEKQGYEAWAVYNDGRYKLAFQYLD